MCNKHINKNKNRIWNFTPPISGFSAKFIDNQPEK